MLIDDRFVLEIEIRAFRTMINARQRQMNGISTAAETAASDARAWLMVWNVRNNTLKKQNSATDDPA